jgi:chromosome partitioning protein
MSARIFSVIMGKGGVGKTSIVTNMAAAISTKYPDKKTIIIDTGSQGNSYASFGIKTKDITSSVYDVFLGRKTIEETKIKLAKNLWLVPGEDDMKYLEFEVLKHPEKYIGAPFQLLKKSIEQIMEQYDYIFFDTPPSLGMVAGNVLAVAQDVIIPYIPDTYSIRGMIRVVDTVNEFRDINPKINISGIVATMVERRTSLHSEMMQEAQKYCQKNGIRVFQSVIPRSIRTAAAVAYDGKPTVWSDPTNPLVQAYFELMDEAII